MRSKNKLIRIGITLGDINGIGPEVAAKALLNPAIAKSARFTIFGNKAVLQKYLPNNLNELTFLESEHFLKSQWTPGQANITSARCSLDYLDKAIEFLKTKKISALVTAPVCKESIAQFHPNFQGHTEYLAEHFHKPNVGMFFIAEHLKTIILTRHIPLNAVSSELNIPLITNTIRLTHQALKDHFKITSPRIAVCGLNPHAGENGLIGTEEQKVIIPAIKKIRAQGILADGPFPADTLFQPENIKYYDAVVAMYHDQGLIPIKTLYFHKVVNFTIGLPIIRTSPSHGTAFDIAGKNTANPTSMMEAVKLAVRLAS